MRGTAGHHGPSHHSSGAHQGSTAQGSWGHEDPENPNFAFKISGNFGDVAALVSKAWKDGHSKNDGTSGDWLDQSTHGGEQHDEKRREHMDQNASRGKGCGQAAMAWEDQSSHDAGHRNGTRGWEDQSANEVSRGREGGGSQGQGSTRQW